MENVSETDPVGETNKAKCAVCKAEASFVCSGCKSVSYCTVDHQKKDWKKHKSSCIFFHVKKDGNEFTGAGNYCEASRNLKAGTIILDEFPVFHVPPLNVHDRCITCAIHLRPVEERTLSNSCPKCNWPVCGIACAELSIHASYECKIFQAHGISYPHVTPSLPITDIASYPLSMRAIGLMIQSPEQWSRLLKMLDWEDVDTKDLDNQIEDGLLDLDAIKTASSRILRINRDGDSLLFDTLAKLTKSMSTQGYQIGIDEIKAAQNASSSRPLVFQNRVTVYFYGTARHFVHSCSPNCVWTVGTFPDFKMQIRTSIEVKKGEKLTVTRFMYNEESARGTLIRQTQFQRHFGAPCRCILCLDPTEFGTNQSAVICQQCNTGSDANFGYLLPVDPTKIADDAPWKCNKCNNTTSVSEFGDQLEEVESKIATKFGKNLMSVDELCQEFMEKYQNKFVHPNHWLIQMAIKSILAWQLPRIPLMDKEQLVGYENFARFLLDIQNKTSPGIHHHRILTISYLCRAMSMRFLAPVFSVGADSSMKIFRMSMEDIEHILEDVSYCQQVQKEALLYYKQSPNIGRGQTDDYELRHLQHEIKWIQDYKESILGRLAQIQMQRLTLGMN